MTEKLAIPVLEIGVPKKKEQNDQKDRGARYTESLESFQRFNPNNEKQSEYKKQEIDKHLTVTEEKILMTLQSKAEAIQAAIKEYKKGESNPKRWNITVSSEWNWVYSTNSYYIWTAFRIIEQDKNHSNIKFEIVYPNNTWFWATLNAKSIGEVVGITNFINSAKDFIQGSISNIIQPNMTDGPSSSFNEEGGNITCRVLRKDIGSLDGKRTILSGNGAELIWLSEVDVKKVVDYLNYLYKQELQNQKVASLLPK